MFFNQHYTSLSTILNENKTDRAKEKKKTNFISFSIPRSRRRTLFEKLICQLLISCKRVEVLQITDKLLATEEKRFSCIFLFSAHIPNRKGE